MRRLNKKYEAECAANLHDTECEAEKINIRLDVRLY